MRAAEWINLVYFVFLSGVACVRNLHGLRRRRIVTLAGIGILLTLAGRLSDRVVGEDWSSTGRNWLPTVTILIAYWQAGQFYIESSLRLQSWLQGVDDRLGVALRSVASVVGSRWVVAYLEVVYLFAYPLIPLALGVLLFSGFGVGDVDHFWTVVLLSSYSCYVMLPFAPTLPPRLAPGSGVDSRREWRENHRTFNLWILDWFGIGANTFPSGHVAATIAASLVLLENAPLAGAVFLWFSVSIAVSTVVRRYHFFVDAVLGALLAVGFRILLGN